MFQRPTGSFECKPNPWVAQSVLADVGVNSWRDDTDKKRLFAQFLPKYPTPFDAALAVFGADTGAALWASVHWLADPIVLAVKAEAVKAPAKILDKDQLCNKLLNISEEKSPQGYYLIEPKDRIACIKLYAEIQGYIGKAETTNFNNFANNNLKVVFVKPDNDHQKMKTVKPVDDGFVTDEIIDQEPEIQIENPDNFKPLPKLKIV